MVIVRKKVAGLTTETLERFVLRARRAIGLRSSVNVLVTSSNELRAMNRSFRGKDKPTDVLSFPSSTSGQPSGLAGDVAISADIASKNAARFGHSAAVEVKILTLHGLLHLAGFDHEKDNGEMERKENELRLQLRLEPGLIERTKSQGTARKNSQPARRTA